MNVAVGIVGIVVGAALLAWSWITRYKPAGGAVFTPAGPRTRVVVTRTINDVLTELRAACDYSDGEDSPETGVESLIAYKDALEDWIGSVDLALTRATVKCDAAGQKLEATALRRARLVMLGVTVNP